VSQPGFDRDAVGVALGARIRAHRRLRKLSLRSLSALSGTSPSFISQLERGQTGASIASLVQIANALGVSLGAFFDGEAHVTPTVMRKQDRPMLSMDNGVKKTLLTGQPADSVEVYAGELDVDGSTGGDTYSHGDAHEVLLVTLGEVELTLGQARLRMVTGDSVEYRTSVPHGVRNVGDGPAEVLWIISPPTSTQPRAHVVAATPKPAKDLKTSRPRR